MTLGTDRRIDSLVHVHKFTQKDRIYISYNVYYCRFPSVDHTCCFAPEDRGRCVKAMPEFDQCGILVKLGDMGVCINPTGHTAGDNLGVKRFSPECNTPTEKKITEKV